jgi:branched-chain amino acid transport system substrate-binding protein
MVLADAMRKAGSADPQKYLPELARIKHAGITGEIEFEKNGELRHGQMSFFRVQNGKWVLQ